MLFDKCATTSEAISMPEGYDTMKEILDSTESTLTPEDAMGLMERVSIPWNGEWDTEWSVVYHVDGFSVDICNDMNYDSVHHFPQK